MNNRKVWFAVCYVVAFGFHIYNNARGLREDWPLLIVPLVMAWVAFILPAMLPVILVEKGAFHFAPWADGHRPTTILWMVLVASTFWFFPTARIARLFGHFDALGEGKRRRPVMMRGFADFREAVNKRLFGRQKTGGWA